MTTLMKRRASEKRKQKTHKNNQKIKTNIKHANHCAPDARVAGVLLERHARAPRTELLQRAAHRDHVAGDQINGARVDDAVKRGRRAHIGVARHVRNKSSGSAPRVIGAVRCAAVVRRRRVVVRARRRARRGCVSAAQWRRRRVERRLVKKLRRDDAKRLGRQQVPAFVAWQEGREWGVRVGVDGQRIGW